MAYIYDLTDTWNAGGTAFNAIKMNVTDSASAAGSKLVTLQTNGTEHFSVTKAGVGYFSGSLGIGTSSPSAKLHVKLATDLNARFINAYSSVALGATTDVGAETKLTFFGNPVAFVTNDTERMRIDSSGNVGIGTSGPASKLHVDNGTSACQLRIRGGFAGSTSPELQFYAASSDHNWTIRGNHSEALQFGKGVYGDFGSELMRLDTNGNLGIGTTTPGGYKLAVTSASNLLALSDGSTQNLLVTVTSGAGSAGAFTFNANNGGQFIWQNAGAEKMRLDGSGNVGIGTSSPSAKLEVYGGSIKFGNASGNALLTADGGATYIGSLSNHPLVLNTNNTERMRIDASGNLNLGQTNSALQSGGTGITVYGSTASEIKFLNSTTGATATDGTALVANGSDFVVNNREAGAITFGTSNTERMRIDSSGNLLVGTTSAIGNGRVCIQAVSGSKDCITSNPSTGASYNFAVMYSNAGATIGSIACTTTATAYNTSSDARLKHDIVDAPEASSLIDAIKVRSFKWNVDNSEQRYGMIAQELLEVVPEAVSHDPDDEEKMMGVDYSKLVPMLVKEIQSLRARVAQLEGN